MNITPKNWASFQHYKDRSPSWIKLHRGLLDDFTFARLPVASRALAPLLWLLASEYEGGKITASPEELAFRLRLSDSDLMEALKPLIDSGFFIASEMLADCKQDACLEKRREERENIEKTEKNGADAPADPSIPERDYFLRGREVLGKGQGALIAKLLKAKGANVSLARAAIEQASQKQNPTEYVAAICRGPPAARPTTAHQQERQTGREILDDIGKYISSGSSEADPRLLRHDSSDGSESIRSRFGGDLVQLSAAGHRTRG